MSSNEKREIESMIRKIQDLVAKEPKRTVTLLTSWINRKEPVSRKTQALAQRIRKAS